MFVAENLDWSGIGCALREKREALGLAQSALAQGACLSRQQIVQLENGTGTQFHCASTRFLSARRCAAVLKLDWDRLLRELDSAAIQAASEAIDVPAPAQAANDVTHRQFPRARRLGAIVAISLLVSAAIVWSLVELPARMPRFAAPERSSAEGGSVSTASVPAMAVPPAAAVAVEGEQLGLKNEELAVLAPEPGHEAAVAHPPASAPAATVADSIVELRGSDPAKRADSFFIQSEKPAVLVRKPLHDDGDGTRLELPAGVARRIRTRSNEIVQVAEGGNVKIFYQGQMLVPPIVEGRTWVRFVPHPGTLQ